MGNFVWPLSYARHPMHSDILRSLARVRLVCAARRSGKTGLARTECFTEACREGAKVWYVAPTHAIAKEVFWDPILELIPSSLIAQVHRTEMWIKLRTGGTIWCKSADNPESLLGRGITYGCFDEFQSLPANIFDAYIDPLIAGTPDKPAGRVLLLGTPRGTGHPFHRLWKQGQAGGLEGWRSWMMTAYDAGMVPREEIDLRRDEALARGKAAFKIWQREWMADWHAFVGQVFDGWDESVHVVDKHPEDWKRAIMGKDWGFSESHEGALGTWLDTPQYWHAASEVVEAHKTVESYWIPRIAEQVGKWRTPHNRRGKENPPVALYCDPARPDHIASVRKAQKGWHTMEANNDVMAGIITLSQYLESEEVRQGKKRLTVHRSCERLREELPSYQWEQTPDGLMKEKPKKANDNTVDQARYALHSEATMPRVSYC